MAIAARRRPADTARFGTWFAPTLAATIRPRQGHRSRVGRTKAGWCPISRKVKDLRARAHAKRAQDQRPAARRRHHRLRARLRGQGVCPEGLVLRGTVPVGARPGNPGGMIVAPRAPPTPPNGSRSSAPKRPAANNTPAKASLARLGVTSARAPG